MSTCQNEFDVLYWNYFDHIREKIITSRGNLKPDELSQAFDEVYVLV